MYLVPWVPKYRLNDETEGSTGFRALRKLYRHPCAKRKGVYRFPRGSKSRRPQGFHLKIQLVANQIAVCISNQNVQSERLRTEMASFIAAALAVR